MAYKGKIFSTSIALILVGLATICGNNIRLQVPDDNMITVDCSAKIPSPKSMVGFLLSVNAAKPGTEYITPLKPAHWRLSSRNKSVLNRVDLLGAKPIFIMSDVFRYPGVEKANWQSPVAALSRWKDTVKSVTKQYNTMVRKPIYDIWNEPNGKFFWDGTKESFFKTFKNGYDQIRSMPNGLTARISGPSISNFDLPFIESFLDYCLANNIKLDVLSWHEFRTGNDIATVKSDILMAKSRFLKNPKYAALNIKAVHVNEVIGQQDQFSPGSILAYFYFLEQGGADATCKACWAESNGKSNCFNNSLDGLLTFDDLTPRAAWWLYRYYNLSLKSRVSSESSNNNVVSFANYTPAKLQILIGYFGDKATNPNGLPINVNVKSIDKIAGFAGKNEVNIKVTALPDSGEDALTSPPVILTTTGKVINGTLQITLPKLNLKAACVVELS